MFPVCDEDSGPTRARLARMSPRMRARASDSPNPALKDLEMVWMDEDWRWVEQLSKVGISQTLADLPLPILVSKTTRFTPWVQIGIGLGLQFLIAQTQTPDLIRERKHVLSQPPIKPDSLLLSWRLSFERRLENKGLTCVGFCHRWKSELKVLLNTNGSFFGKDLIFLKIHTSWWSTQKPEKCHRRPSEHE